MLTVLVTLLPLTVLAAPVKVGVIDFEKLFTETKTARVDKAELDRLLTTKQTEVDLRKATLQKARAELVAAAKTMDAVARARREAELDAENAALKKLFEEAQTLVNARERELTNRVVSDAKLIAPELAKQKGILMVLGAAEALFWTAPSVVQVDLTAEIARALDQRLALKTTR
jgi:Skp family chaperone for outer membrane proteins